MEQLTTIIDTQTIPKFSLCGMKLYGRVIDVYDGDTITIVLPLFNSLFSFKTRLYGIDTCEVRSKCDSNKKYAIQARNRLIQLITKNAMDSICMLESKSDIKKFFAEKPYIVWVHCMEFDKYGRVMVDLFEDNIPDKLSFSQILLNEHLAYTYTGGTKLTELQQLDFLNSSPN